MKRPSLAIDVFFTTALCSSMCLISLCAQNFYRRQMKYEFVLSLAMLALFLIALLVRDGDRERRLTMQESRIRQLEEDRKKAGEAHE